MGISTILSTAFSGLRANAAKAQAAANNVVNADTPGYRPGLATTTSLVAARGIDGGSGVQVQLERQDGEVELVREFTQLSSAEAAYKASASLIRTAEETHDALIDAIR